MASIVATPLPALGVIRIDVNMLPQRSDPVNLYRVTPDGVRTHIIGSPMNLSGGVIVAYDTSAPFDVPLHYRAEIRRPVIGLDNFARSVSNGWGSDDLGNTYTRAGGVDSEFSVTSSRGRIQLGSVNVSRQQHLTDYPNLTDVRIRGITRPGVTPTGGFIQPSLAVRWTGTNNFYLFAVQFHPGGTMVAQIQRRTSATMTTVALAEHTLSGSWSSGEEVAVEGEIDGSTLRMRAWQGNRRPGWQISTSDSSHTEGYVGYRGVLGSSNTNTLPVTVWWDTTQVTSLNPIVITTAASVTLEAAPHGWIRDPRVPARSIRLDNCDTHTFSCLDSERFVFFQGLDEEEYRSATGVFEVLNSENPITVAQVRKGISTGLRFVSTTLADIPPLRLLFRSGRKLVLSLPTQYGWGITSYGSDTVTAGDVTVSRLHQRDMRKPQRLWQVPIRVTDQDLEYPTNSSGSNNIPLPGATYGDLRALGLPYADVDHVTYADWAKGVFV